MSDVHTVVERILYSIAIVYSETLYARVREFDEQFLISIVSVILSAIFAFGSARLKTLLNQDMLWGKLVTHWMDIFSMFTTFIAIHSIVAIVENMMDDTERFAHESFIFPIFALLSGVSAVVLTEGLLAGKLKSD